MNVAGMVADGDGVSVRVLVTVEVDEGDATNGNLLAATKMGAAVGDGGFCGRLAKIRKAAIAMMASPANAHGIKFVGRAVGGTAGAMTCRFCCEYAIPA